MTPIDEAALKAGISDSEIMEIADRWFCTGENQHRSDGYYYRSLGTPTNVRGSDLIAFARALLSSHHEDGGRAATDKKSARDTALEQAANLVECEYAADATQGRRLAQIAQHIRDLKKRNQS